MKYFYLIIFGLFVLSCNSKSIKTADQYWQDGQNLRSEQNLMGSITSFKSLVHNYPKHKLAADAQFQIADIYLNDNKNYELAIDQFKTVISNYPEYEVAKKSLFMIAYIYNNYLEAFSDAIINYNNFKNKYPNDQLIPSVEYELNGLREISKTIDSLKLINKENKND